MEEVVTVNRLDILVYVPRDTQVQRVLQVCWVQTHRRVRLLVNDVPLDFVKIQPIVRNVKRD